MKRLLLSAAFMSALCSTSIAQVSTYSVGDVVDDFTVTDTHGNEISLYEITANGQYVYLDFFFDTCPPCQGTSPIFGDFYDKYGCNGGDIFCLAVNNGTDSDAEVIAYEDEYGGSGHHAPAISADGGGGAVTTAFGVGAFPTYCLIGPDNKLVLGDIWPIDDITTLEGTFGGDLDPEPMPCSFASISDENSELSGLSVYPNPATNNTTLSFDAVSSSSATITLFNLIGETMQVETVSVTTGQNNVLIDTENFTAGNYIVQVKMENTVVNTKFNVVK